MQGNGKLESAFFERFSTTIFKKVVVKIVNIIQYPGKELHLLVQKISNLLKQANVKKGDAVALYLPSCIIAAASMLVNFSSIFSVFKYLT